MVLHCETEEAWSSAPHSIDVSAIIAVQDLNKWGQNKAQGCWWNRNKTEQFECWHTLIQSYPYREHVMLLQQCLGVVVSPRIEGAFRWLKVTFVPTPYLGLLLLTAPWRWRMTQWLWCWPRFLSNSLLYRRFHVKPGSNHFISLCHGSPSVTWDQGTSLPPRDVGRINILKTLRCWDMR